MRQAGRDAVHVFISAGEASGDLHGANLARAVTELRPGTRISCLGGPLLVASGAEVQVNNRDISVVGIFEVFRHLKKIYGAYTHLRSFLTIQRPDVVVLIDFPDFNFLLGRVARRLGIRLLYYISPQVWAWRSGRMKKIRELADEIAVILPFEQEFYARAGIEVRYPGHPLLDVLGKLPPVAEARRLYHSGNGPLIGLLPGSRHSEIRSMLPVLLDAAELIRRKNRQVSFIIPVAATIAPEMILDHVRHRSLPIRVVPGDTYRAIQACDLALTVSGTVTLETAIIGTPMIITYRVSNLTYYTGRHLIKVDHVGLPNLVAGREIVPELLQGDCNAELIASKALAFLRKPEMLDRQRTELARIRGALGEPGVARRVAELVLALAEKPNED